MSRDVQLMAKRRKGPRTTRTGKTYPEVCYGNEHKQHHAFGCRPGRPLCRWMRKVRPKRRPCFCGAYHHPHRAGSGRCGNPEKLAEWVYGPLPDEELEREAIEQEPTSDRPSGVYAVVGFDEATGSDDEIPF